MITSNNAYRQIFKAFSIFGGVQVVTILILMIKSKFVALYLGPSGFGISSLFNSNLALIGALISLGIPYSAVKNIASANGTGDSYVKSETIIVFSKWTHYTGIVGTLLVILFARRISIWTFGNTEYTWSFIFLSITIFLTTYSNGRKTILQGLGKLKNMASLSIWSSVFGLITIPMYYYYGIKGIVPALIITAIISGIVSWYYSKEINVESIKVSNRQAMKTGLDMVKFGALITLSGYFYLFGIYVLNVFINNVNGPEDVGLYQAGWLITNQFVSLVLTAMSMDYYPKLAAINKDNSKIKDLVNQQAEITLLIIGPLIVLLIIFVSFAIKIFLTNSFIQLTNFIQLTALGILFKAVLWCMGFILLVKGDTKKYMILELTGYSVIFSSYMFGYYFYGINGIGISYIFSNIIFLLVYYIVINKAYNFTFNSTFIRLFINIMFLCLLVYISTLFTHGLLLLLIRIVIFVTIAIYSIAELDKRIAIKELIKQVFQRNRSMN